MKNMYKSIKYIYEENSEKGKLKRKSILQISF